MTKSFGDYDSAVAVSKVVSAISDRRSDSTRPQSRYAIVKTIDREARSCGVVYVGETGWNESDPEAEMNLVKVSCGALMPARVGQEVRVSGSPHDRHIDDIRGPADSEERTEDLERFRDTMRFAAGEWSLSAPYSIANNTSAIPISSVTSPGDFNPVGQTADGEDILSMSSSGILTFNYPGYFRAESRITLAGEVNANGVYCSMQLRLKRPGQEFEGIDQDALDTDLGSSAYRINRFTMNVARSFYAPAGSQLYASGFTSGDGTRKLFTGNVTRLGVYSLFLGGESAQW